MRIVSFGLVFAVLTVAVQWGIHLLLSPYSGDWRYRAGGVVGGGTHLILGALAAWPLCSKRLRRGLAVVITLLVGALFTFGAVGGYHYHTVFNRLPGPDTLEYLVNPGALSTSIGAHAPTLLIASEILFVIFGALLLSPLFAVQLGRLPRRRFIAAVAVSLAIAGGTTPLLTGQARWGALHPLLHLAVAVQTDPMPPPQIPKSRLAECLDTVGERLGFKQRPAPDLHYPYCTGNTAVQTTHAHRSILIVILEGISNREVHATHQGLPLMPKLNRAADQGLSFLEFKAVGDRSSQALFSLLAGVPPETHRRVISHSRLVSFTGFPRQMARAGFETVYLHGSDLSFEQQRRLVRKGGYERIIEPDSETLKTQTAWGLADGVMLEEMRQLVDDERAARPNTPLLATLFTLSTHDPYQLPDDRPRVFEGDDDYTRFAESIRYLDDVLDAFIQWYIQNEKPRGTVLAVVSDHAPRIKRPDDPADTSTGEFEYRFGVPLVLLGNAIDALANRDEIATRPGSHADLSRTLAALAGVTPPACSAGHDLLASDFPDDRWVVSMAGDRLEYAFVHDPPFRWTAHLTSHELQLFDAAADPKFRRDLFDGQRPGWREVTAFVDAYTTLGAYLNLEDRFAPPKPPATKPTLPPMPPRIVSHHGQTRGPGAGPRENSMDAFDAAVAAGFEWVELDVQLTADRIPVVYHDAALPSAKGAVPISTLSLEALREQAGFLVPTLGEVLSRYDGRIHFLVELKKQESWFLSMQLTHEALALIAEVERSKVMVDSFSSAIVSAAAEFSDVEVGWDVPQKPFSDDWLTFALDQRLDWFLLRRDLAGAPVIEKLHAHGFKVMVYTVNHRADLDGLTEAFPDGIITDRADFIGTLGKTAPTALSQ